MKCLFESVTCEHRNTGGCSRGDCVFAPQGNVESPSHSVQQLKAEIRAVVSEHFEIIDGIVLGCHDLTELGNKLRQLSAV